MFLNFLSTHFIFAKNIVFHTQYLYYLLTHTKQCMRAVCKDGIESSCRWTWGNKEPKIQIIAGKIMQWRNFNEQIFLKAFKNILFELDRCFYGSSDHRSVELEQCRWCLPSVHPSVRHQQYWKKSKWLVIKFRNCLCIVKWAVVTCLQTIKVVVKVILGLFIIFHILAISLKNHFWWLLTVCCQVFCQFA